MILFALKLHRAECILVTGAFCSDKKYGPYGYYTKSRGFQPESVFNSSETATVFFFFYII